MYEATAQHKEKSAAYKERIKKMMMKKTGVAERVGISNVHLSRVLNLKSPLTTELEQKLDKYLGV